MKVLSFILSLLLFQSVYAQDSLEVVYTQEQQDTIVKQRFIDRYENVFMTKVPTRHMFKFGLTFSPNYLFAVENSQTQSTSYHVGYEYKAFPSFSVGTEITAGGGWGSQTDFSGTLFANVYGRWYYDMKRRIKEGVNVNNFTGNYLAIVAEKSWGIAESNYQLSRFGTEFGLQRRFLNNGRIEFAIGAFYQLYQKGYYPALLSYEQGKKSDFAIVSRTSMGLAFGDWRRNRNAAICDVLRCDESLSQQWKLLWPKIYLSSRFAQATAGLAYERKLGNLPLSVNAQINADYMRIVSSLRTGTEARRASNDIQIWPSLQLRYYLDTKEKLRRGTGGNNLSGVYLGPHSDFVYYNSETIFSVGRPKRHLGAGAALGYQQTLFGKAYLDFAMSSSYNFLKPGPYEKHWLSAIRLGFGLTL
jgi:hypothetical protein